MKCYEIPNLRFALETAGAVGQHLFVNVDATGKAILPGAGKSAIGASTTEATKVGEVLDVADGIVIVIAGATVAAGADVEVDAAGKAITKNTGIKAGVALTGGAVGEYLTVKI